MSLLNYAGNHIVTLLLFVYLIVNYLLNFLRFHLLGQWRRTTGRCGERVMENERQKMAKVENRTKAPLQEL